MAKNTVIAMFVIASVTLGTSVPAASGRAPDREAGAGVVEVGETDLDTLFARLLEARDAEDANSIEKDIWAAWLRSGSDTVDLLVSRAATAIDARDYPLAMQLLDSAIELKPDYAESWNKRATLHYLMNNFGESIGDIRRTLALEPRHFGAMTGLGSIFRILGDHKSALEVYRRALEVHPSLFGAARAVEVLAEKVEGRGI